MSSRSPAAWISLLCASLLLAGCAGSSCDKPGYYQDSGSTAQIVVPEGQTPPDTRAALRIPPPATEPQVRAEGSPCLEEPPKYFEQSGAIVGSPEALIYAWADAFGQKDFDRLSALYSDYFTPSGGDLQAWRNGKMQQMQQLGDARVVVESLSMAPAAGGRMVARFVQRIQLGNNLEETRKELVLVRDKNTWSIISESDLDSG